jgi:hypothetical protein
VVVDVINIYLAKGKKFKNTIWIQKTRKFLKKYKPMLNQPQGIYPLENDERKRSK